jgi:HD-GYP domain-containing protein (c-di-GMP phosphodiesterase class II)
LPQRKCRPGADGGCLPFNEALEQIEQQAGTAFDPMRTELFCRTMREQPPQQ